ncbi:MAG: hypothetical protein GY776_12315 [Alteromonas sp.]|nr:hypothetical protein [Alteromonas sp.]
MTNRLKAEFPGYHKANPDIYKLFSRITAKHVQARDKIGAKGVMEQVRSSLKRRIDNSYTSYYAEKFETDNPAHKGFFEFRR